MSTVQKIVYRPGCDVLPLNSWSQIYGRISFTLNSTQIQDGYSGKYARYSYSASNESWTLTGEFPCQSGDTLSGHNKGTTYPDSATQYVFELQSGSVNRLGAKFVLPATPDCNSYLQMVVTPARRNTQLATGWQVVGARTTVPLADVDTEIESGVFLHSGLGDYPTYWSAWTGIRIDSLSRMIIASSWFDNTNLQGDDMILSAIEKSTQQSSMFNGCVCTSYNIYFDKAN